MIWALPAIPSGFWLKSIDGDELIFAVEDDREVLEQVLARAVAVWVFTTPRSASSRVISWNLSSPSSVNCSSTIGCPDWSKSWRVPLELEVAPGHLGNGIGVVGRTVGEHVVVRPASGSTPDPRAEDRLRRPAA